MGQIGAEGMRLWHENYDTWKRVIQPTESALSRPGAVLENIVISACMSIEAAGSLIGSVQGEADTYARTGRPTTATYVFRCLARLGLKWQEAAESVTGLARAVANNYNTIKHYDRGEFPDLIQTYLIGQVAMTTVRLLATNLIDPSGQLVRNYEVDPSFGELKGEFEAQDIFIDSAGNFVKYPT
jgi:hypothetical protein